MLKDNKVTYRVKSLKDLITIITHFENYPLITNKYADFVLFKYIIEIMKSKEHLTNKGLLKILSLKASLNNGLPEKLKECFPDITPACRPLISLREIKEPQWLSGFTSGEGCFLIDAYKSRNTLGVGVTLRFKLAQHTRDSDLMKSLKQYLGCGNYYSKSTGVGEFIVAKFSVIRDKIIPFFERNPIAGVKHSDFSDFKAAAELIENKSHLTQTGLEKILSIKAGMNTGR